MASRLWSAVRAWHGFVARWPKPLAGAYLAGLGMLSRSGPAWLAPRVHNSTFGANSFSTAIRFRPRTVLVGDRTTIRLTPHAGELDGRAVFDRRLRYENGVFRWLEQAAAHYDVIVEIGANVGVYTVFLDKMARASARPRRIYAFEPSAEPYRRLCENLAANEVRKVSAFPVAVADKAGFASFYEPAGHLTNGSFVKEFAAIFSDDVQESQVLCCAAADLTALAKPGERVLLKVDVEGYEPTLLRHLEPFLAAHRPDILIEVLGETVVDIARFAVDGGYRCSVIREQLVEQPAVYADPMHRDWLLEAPQPAGSTPAR